MEGSIRRRWRGPTRPSSPPSRGWRGFAPTFPCTPSASRSRRRPSTSVPGWHFALDYKIALVIAQAAGYAISKLIGVKVISEISPARRGGAILGLIGASWLALIAFALIPAPWNVAALFLNGLPLGMIWGLVFGYMEGRRVSEVLGSILCASFILSSGVVKSVGAWLMQTRSTSASSGCRRPPARCSFRCCSSRSGCWACCRRRAAEDEAERVQARADERGRARRLPEAYAPGLVLLVLAYILLTAFRDFRDNFAAEIWTALGYGKEAGSSRPASCRSRSSRWWRWAR